MRKSDSPQRPEVIKKGSAGPLPDGASLEYWKRAAMPGNRGRIKSGGFRRAVFQINGG